MATTALRVAPAPRLPSPLAVYRKPNSKSSFFLQGPMGRNVALVWSLGEAEALAAAVAACEELIRGDGTAECVQRSIDLARKALGVA